MLLGVMQENLRHMLHRITKLSQHTLSLIQWLLLSVSNGCSRTAVDVI